MSEYVPLQLDKKLFNDFYIRSLSEQTYKLKLPLPPHRKTVNDFILLTKGSITKSSGLDNFKVAKSSICLLPAGQITTTTEITPDIEGYYCHFSDSYLVNTNIDLNDWMLKPIVLIEKNEMPPLIALLDRINFIYSNSANHDLIKAYLVTFLTELKFLSGGKTKTAFTASERIAHDFKKLVSQKVTRQTSVNEYAKELHVTPNHLNKSVKTTFGKSASAIVDEMLLLEAKVLMCQHTQSVSEVSFAIGFEDPSYFGRFFKKHTGMTPTEFRKLIDLSD